MTDTDHKDGHGKVCTKCGKWKLLEDYHKKTRSKDGKGSKCKACACAQSREWRGKNIERATEKLKEWRKNNKEHLAEYSKAYRAQNEEDVKRRWLDWHARNRTEVNQRKREKRLENPEAERIRNRDWKLNNPERYKLSYMKSSEKTRNDNKKRLERTLSQGVRSSLRKGAKNGRRTFEILGYTLDELRCHLESLFQPGMTWENHGRGGWHIDHIIPLSAHNYETPEDIDFKKAWALSNLQPLWEFENLSKGPRLTKPFQPSLAFFS